MIPSVLLAQTYTSYRTGSDNDIETDAGGGICLMGGATEHDEAMKWFLSRANGGDVLVLRTSGSDGYNDYMYNLTTEPVNSVETIVCHDAGCAGEIYIHEKIESAEAIWFAGGDQWEYISYWQNTSVDSLIQAGIDERNVVIGGTSAGMAILGGMRFSAENGTVTSDEALTDPYNTYVTIDTSTFIQLPFMNNVITDTHYDNPDRKGRHMTFIARLLTDYGIPARGIACDEYTAVCIDENRMASVYGEYPDYEDFAWFVFPNCEIQVNLPENCSSGEALTWHQGEEAVKVIKIPGTMEGSNQLDLNDWLTQTGGEWYNWYADTGAFYEIPSSAPACSPTGFKTDLESFIKVYPNPANQRIHFSQRCIYALYNAAGKLIKQGESNYIEVSGISTGFYMMHIQHPETGNVNSQKVVIN